MKSPLSLILFLTLLCAVAFATPKKNVAIYMAGTESIKGSHKVLGTELAKVLTKSSAYTAVDRSETGRKIVAQEHIFQRSGAVEKNQVKKLGKQLGVQIVCIAEITKVMESHYLEARLVDVETAEVFNIASEPGNMSGATDIVRTAKSVAQELLGEAKIVNYSFREIETNPSMAIEDYTEAIRQQPNVAEYYFKRGVTYYNKEDYDRAIFDFNEAIRLNPNNAVYFFYRGLVYRSKDDNDRAISDNTEAIRLNPNFAAAYSSRAAVYAYKKDDYDKAIADYTKSIRLEPDAAVYSFRADAYKSKGDYDRAIADYTEVIRMKPNDIYLYERTYMDRAEAYINKSDYDRAIADYTEVIRMKPNNKLIFANSTTVYDFRGRAYEKKGDYNKAKADYESILRIDPNDSGAKYRLEEIKEKMKK